MPKWKHFSNGRWKLTLAADPRFSPTDYCNDHIWELRSGMGEPPALAIETTFGLRARYQRIFPRFKQGTNFISDPAEFHQAPEVLHYHPNYIQVSFSPFEAIDVVIDYWVPASQVIAGRTTITNNSPAAQQIAVEWVSQLAPLPEGERMTLADIETVTVLAGKSADLAPVLFLSGGAQAGSGTYPALLLKYDLESGACGQNIWAQAALADRQQSFEKVRTIAFHNWEAERAHLIMRNSNQIEILTGNPDWDFIFDLSQVLARGLFLNAVDDAGAPSFVQSRQPDFGYTLRGDGSDYNHLWNGQTLMDACYLTDLLLPGEVECVKGVLANFLATQTEAGFIDWKPGLAGQRSQILSAPLVSDLAWRIYQVTEDLAYLESIFPNLLAFLHFWFDRQNDRDEDGIPEWSHAVQTGIDDHPLYAYWNDRGQGTQVSSVESPDLCALLFNECQTLVKIARLVKREDVIGSLESLSDSLRTAVETSWDEDQACYHYWDRESHLSNPNVPIGSLIGSGVLTINREFEQPLRLLIKVKSDDQATRSLNFFIHGTAPSGEHRIERITPDRFRWFAGIGYANSDRIYQSLEKIDMQGLASQDLTEIGSVNYLLEDHTLLLPLWSRLPSKEHARALINKTITNPKKYWRPYGIPTSLISQPSGVEAESQSVVYLPFTAWIGKGLVDYGSRAKAAELVKRLMKALINSIEKEGAFRRLYDAETGSGQAEINALGGLAPLGLFMETLGVRIFSAKKVALSGFNPFPWSVTVKYQGLTVLRQKKKTMLIFPNGQSITINNGKDVIVQLD